MQTSKFCWWAKRLAPFQHWLCKIWNRIWKSIINHMNENSITVRKPHAPFNIQTGQSIQHLTRIIIDFSNFPFSRFTILFFHYVIFISIYHIHASVINSQPLCVCAVGLNSDMNSMCALVCYHQDNRMSQILVQVLKPNVTSNSPIESLTSKKKTS